MDYTKVFNELKNLLNWLEKHNKNYTKEQYYKILDAQEIVENCINERSED